jgi:hypothetical protein
MLVRTYCVCTDAMTAPMPIVLRIATIWMRRGGSALECGGRETGKSRKRFEISTSRENVGPRALPHQRCPSNATQHEDSRLQNTHHYHATQSAITVRVLSSSTKTLVSLKHQPPKMCMLCTCPSLPCAMRLII